MKMLPFVPVILPAVVILFWSVRIFLKSNVRNMQLLMVAGMLMAVMTLFAREDTVAFLFPFFFLAIRSITAKDGITKWDWMVFLPSVLFIPFNDTLAFIIFLCIQVTVLSVWLVVDVFRYNRLKAEFFDTGSDTSNGISQITFYYIATVIVIIVVVALPSEATSEIWFDWYSY